MTRKKSPAKKVLFLPVSIGSGHIQAAAALTKALRRQRPDWLIQTVDVLKYINPLVKGIYKDWYLFAIRKAPVAWKFIYKETEDFKKYQQILNKPRFFLEEMNAWPLERYLKKLAPDIVICTHFFPLSLTSYWRRFNAKLNFVNLAVITDHGAHRFWIHPAVDRYYVANDEVAAYAEAQGINPGIIARFGIPINSKFTQSYDRAKIRRQLDLNPEIPTLLLITDNIEAVVIPKLIKSLDRYPGKLQGFIINGKKSSRARLRKLLEEKNKLLKVIDRVPDLEKYYAVADVLISKPGGLTVSESLAMNLPMIIVNPLMGQEEQNRDYLLENGAALSADVPDVLDYKLKLFFGNKSRRQSLLTNIKSLARPEAAANIASDIIKNYE
jgi:processive 1,2-diacylglycerol beta-glucosyltransferase